MKLFLYILLLIPSIFCVQYELFDYNPIANPDAVVIVGNARFTVLTSKMVRMEFALGAKFEDRATYAFVNRNLPVPQFSKITAGGILTISTEHLRLTYNSNMNVFNSTSLQIISMDNSFQDWKYGDPPNGNLYGTLKSLDGQWDINLNCSQIVNVTINNEANLCTYGVASRSGWATFEDSDNYPLNSEYYWMKGVNSSDFVDQYFFGYGDKYKDAVYALTLVSGKVAMVPRYTTGIFWSRWYNYDNYDVKKVVENYRDRDLPLDVYVIDMDWHVKPYWGSYTFDSRLFPNPKYTLDWLHDQGLHVALNLHDDSGVKTVEATYDQFKAALGYPPNYNENITFDIIDQKYGFALDDVVIKNLKDQGMDITWIDWQQGGKPGGLNGKKQNPIIVLNHLRATDNLRKGINKRDAILSRYGGIGNQRYQLGFSGDVLYVDWEDLAYQPFFTSTSANVAFGFWSHDIVGPPAVSPKNESHELFTRWIQWGAYSPVFRTHDRGMSAGSCADNDPDACYIVRLFDVPTSYFNLNRDAVRQREQLIPYIYNHWRQAFETGLSLLRPLYYEFPKEEMAYICDRTGNFSQYFFGEDMMVAPIVQFSSAQDKMARKNLWIPPGNWFNIQSGKMWQGPKTYYDLKFDLSEIPIFAKAGAVIPKIPLSKDVIGIAKRPYNELILDFYPGANSGHTKIYEDDGISTDYIKDAFFWTHVNYTRSQNTISIIVSNTDGKFDGKPETRKYHFNLVNFLPLSERFSNINGKTIKYNPKGGPNTWRFDGTKFTTIVESEPISTDSKTVIKAIFETETEDNNYNLDGYKGLILKSYLSKHNLDLARVCPGAHSGDGGDISIFASSAEQLEYLVGTNTTAFYQLLNNYPTLFRNAYTEIMSLDAKNSGTTPQRIAYSQSLMDTALYPN
eukprot:TRINITY_DN5176_c0_g1_i1.p1 TRINITY_DN5176_c0_g1~~TRINITY_DN5176_c0_g1_i1.p1  ORF type:complete len:906 (-),score=217.02 TRINITY_DN5176_c0_g1_i1:46-2763(-)